MATTAKDDLVEHHAISPDDFHDCIPRIAEVAHHDLIVADDLTDRLKTASDGMLLDDGVLDECVAALIAGHLVLQGPPGTGKSMLARALATAFNVDTMPVTAHEDWSTFEVIGRQELRVDDKGAEAIVPVNGHFTEAVIRCAGNIPANQDDTQNPQATWLLIDELNRAHPDKAFGELFSVLGTDEPVDIILSHQYQGNNLMVVPRRFRVVATVNSIDRQFVNALSQGIRRRFTFLTIGVPRRRPTGEPWTSNESTATREFSLAKREAAKRAARRIGTAEAELVDFLDSEPVGRLLEALFDLAESVRYAAADSDYPHIAVGTATLIDATELFLIRTHQDGLTADHASSALDWATSVRIVPLFDAGGVNRPKLHALAQQLSPPFDKMTRRALLEIEADGLYYVD